MKYLLREYAAVGNLFLTPEEREQSEKQWEIACREYGEYIKNNKNIFSKSFLNAYQKDGFHDYNIKNVNLDFADCKNSCKQLNVIISLEHHGKMCFLISKEVTDFSSVVDISNGGLICDYLYGEYFKDDNELWHHNFLFGDYNEINITSRKFIFKKNTYY